VWKARLIAEGIVVQRGKTVGLVECAVTDQDGRLIAKATSTCLTLRGQQAAGR
jgi:acyl-coenzyme A thioesterase PaaI-like protein